MKDKKIILDIIIMAVCGALVALLCTSYVNSQANAKEAAIRELIGDAEITVAEGHADGYAGDITAIVSYAGDVIVDLQITNAGETPDIGGKAIESLKNTILEKHTFEGVDVVSGATFSSNGVINAIKDAMGIKVVVKTDEELRAEAAATLLPGSAKVDTALFADDSTSSKAVEVWADNSGKIVVFTESLGHYNGATPKQPLSPVKSAVVLNEKGAVESILVVSSREDFLGELEKAKYFDQYYGATLVSKRSGADGTHIDTVSEATESSDAIYYAVKAAFGQFAML